MILLSVHVPKCSGTSFIRWLESAYGADAILYDYGDRLLDPTVSFNTDFAGFVERAGNVGELPPGKTVVHGHFWAGKYRRVPDAIRITFLRHPLDRLISHYFFWHNTHHDGHALHRQFLAERPDILTFCRLPAMRHFYRDVMFRGIDPGSFEFVGDFRSLDVDVRRLERMLGVAGNWGDANRNPEPDYTEKRLRIVDDARLRGELETLLADDIALYEHAVARQR